jgi:hypothetical protein
MRHPTISVEAIERALLDACRRTHAEILAFTVAPRLLSAAQPWDGYDVLIEFADPPRAPDRFAGALDEALCRFDARYRTGRLIDGSIAPPHVVEVPAGTFHRWRRGTGRTVPRVSGTREVADDVLAVATVGRVPLIALG